MTVSDVYLWMKSEGHYPRIRIASSIITKASSSRKEPIESSVSARLFCSFCGMQTERHTSDNKPGNASVHLCDLPHWVTQRPMLDLQHLLQRDVSPKPVDVAYPLLNELMSVDSIVVYRKMLATLDPNFVYAIRNLVGSLSLSCFPMHSETNGHDDFTRTDDVGQVMKLASSAILTSALKAFIPLLISRALTILEKVPELPGIRLPHRGKPEPRLLTPAHVLRGIMGGNNTSIGFDSITLCLAQLGLEKGHEIEASDRCTERPGSSCYTDDVKMEQE